MIKYGGYDSEEDEEFYSRKKKYSREDPPDPPDPPDPFDDFGYSDKCYEPPAMWR